jgi:uncharacterized protein
MLRVGTAPAAVVMARPDPILVVGALVAQSLYGLTCPIVISMIDRIASGDEIEIGVSDSGDAELVVR